MRISLAFLLLFAAQPAVAQTTVPVAVAAPHERQLPLQGGRNFRDLGGYRAADGRTVKWGLLFRSGSMHGLTEADYRYLESRNIRTVCDFRDTHERANEPVNWPAAGGAPNVLSTEYVLDMHFMPPGDPKSWTPEQTSAALAASYPQMLSAFNSQYRRMFAELLAGHAPLAFNCSAGKDRTGIAAALLLTALGIPRATVIDDYLLTNRYLDPKSLLPKPGAAGAPNSPLANVSPQALAPMMSADRRYIEAAFAVIDAHAGGTEGYLHDELGLSQTDLKRLRDIYLTRSQR